VVSFGAVAHGIKAKNIEGDLRKVVNAILYINRAGWT